MASLLQRVEGWWWPWTLGLSLLLALTQPQAQPFVSNQNQYFVHVVAGVSQALADDWLAATMDPYPLFSWLGRLLVDAGGVDALVIASYVVTAVALLAVGLICRALAEASRAWIAWVGMLVAALSLRLPSWMPAGPRLTAFDGLAGQYLVTREGYVQPSSSGVLVLVALGLWLGWARENKRPGRVALVVVPSLCALAAAIHPTYMIVVGVGVVCAVVADVSSGRNIPWLGYVMTGAVTAGAALAANPAIRTLGGSVGGSSSALDRFAFERIPHHTLISSWNLAAGLAIVLVIVVGSLLAYPLAARGWLTSWMTAALLVSLVSAVVVDLTRFTSLALAFPWRVTVVLVPLSIAIITVRMVPLFAPFLRGTWVLAAALVGSAVLLVSGVAETASPPARAAVQVVTASDPQGVGLIPLDQELVRLNAQVPVYVDWKSPPYASDDLEEYWRRVDQVRQVQSDPAGMCRSVWSERVDWVLWPRPERLPSCAADWPLSGSNAWWAVVLRPTE